MRLLLCSVCVLTTVLSAIDATASTIYTNDFQAAIGPEWSHTNTSVTPIGSRRFLGEFGDDSVTLSLSGLPGHSQIQVDFQLFILKSWDGSQVLHPGTSGAIGPDLWSFTVDGTDTLLNATFSNVTVPSSGFTAFQSFPGDYPGPNNLPRTGASEGNTLGYQGTGFNERTEGDAVYLLSFLFSHSSSSLQLAFAGNTVTNPGGTDIQDESWGIDNLIISLIGSPLLSTTPSNGGTANFGYVLVDNPAIKSIAVANTGDPGSTLNGLFPAATGEFGSATTSPFSLPQGSSTSRDYSYTPSARGSDSQDVTVTSNGGDSTITLQGVGVAPIAETSHTDAPLTRIGTSSTLPPEIVIENIGDGNLSGLGPISNLNGTIDTGTDSRFVGGGTSISLPDHTSTSVPITYTPTTHSVDTSTFTVDYANGSSNGLNQPESVEVQVSGQGVGPTYESNPTPGSTLDFGAVVIGSSTTLPLAITNSSTDPNGGDTTLTDLTLLSAVISGPDAAEFNLVGFTPGTVLNQQDLINLLIEFSPQFGPGNKDATLTFLTDEGAAFGSPGLSFSYSLSGVGTPEPASLLGFAVVGGIALLARRRWRLQSTR